MIVSDHLMPVMNGADVVTEARRVKPDIPALLVTGYANFPHGAGIDLPRLTKPFRQAELASRIAELFEADRQRKPAQERRASPPPPSA